MADLGFDPSPTRCLAPWEASIRCLATSRDAATSTSLRTPGFQYSQLKQYSATKPCELTMNTSINWTHHMGHLYHIELFCFHWTRYSCLQAMAMSIGFPYQKQRTSTNKNSQPPTETHRLSAILDIEAVEHFVFQKQNLLWTQGTLVYPIGSCTRCNRNPNCVWCSCSCSLETLHKAEKMVRVSQTYSAFTRKKANRGWKILKELGVQSSKFVW